MSKELTEQWKDGTLDNGMYYVVAKDEDGLYITRDTHDRMFNVWGILRDKDVKEVLAPVPSYEEWKTAKENLEKNGTWYTERSHNELLKQIERLQEQLKDACEVIKIYAETTVGHKQKDGTYRLSVATGAINFLDPFFGMTSEMQEYVYDPRPAKKYLKKWGVK